MVDCFDRLHLKLSELVLEPLKDLRSQPLDSEVTVRPPGRGCRVHVTIRKHPRDESGSGAVYEWSAREIDRSGDELPGGRSWSGEEPSSSPERAYWAAVDVISASRRASRP